MTYLELCVKLRGECGIQGTGPTTVLAQTGLLGKIVAWIADADQEICDMWLNWNFLWDEFTATTVIATAQVTQATDLSTWDTDSFYLDYTTANHKKLIEMDYSLWRRVYRNGVKTSAKPSFFVIRPDKDIILEAPPDDEYTLTADYWKYAARLSANTSASLIPARFQRIIIARAKMYFAEHENAPEVMEGAQMEYGNLLSALQAAELPGQGPTRTGSNDLVVVVE